jgi:RNA polymerase sigma factor (sigma-70 family)
MDDWQLLNDYATGNSEEAFRALAERYAGMVYHAALRQSGNPDTAQEITQAVFIALARKAGKIPKQTILYGWLFRATRFAVLKRLRDDDCRRRREEQALDMQNQTQSDDSDAAREKTAALLDDALELLSSSDREAVMMRYFGDKSHKEVAPALGVSEDTAKKRVSRALERLRAIFARHGVAVPSAALAASLAAHSAQAAPLGLPAAIAAAAVAKAPAASSAVALAEAVVKIMAWAKAKTAAAVAAGVLFAAGTTTVTVQQIHRHSVSFWEDPNFTVATLRAAPPQVTIVPSRFPSVGRAIVTDIDSDKNPVDQAQLMGLGIGLEGMLQFARHGAGLRHIAPPDLPSDLYDFIANLPSGSRSALAELVRKRFGYVAKREAREFNDALAITVDHSDAPGMTLAAPGLGPDVELRDGQATPAKPDHIGPGQLP